MQWSIASKAAERSKSVRRETLPESSARRMSFVILRRAVYGSIVHTTGRLAHAIVQGNCSFKVVGQEI